MKKALTIAATALALAAPAHAIDYVKCEAMNKMYGRLTVSMRSALESGEAKRFVDLSEKAALVRIDYEKAGCVL